MLKEAWMVHFWLKVKFYLEDRRSVPTKYTFSYFFYWCTHVLEILKSPLLTLVTNRSIADCNLYGNDEIKYSSKSATVPTTHLPQPHQTEEKRENSSKDNRIYHELCHSNIKNRKPKDLMTGFNNVMYTVDCTEKPWSNKNEGIVTPTI